MIDSLSEGLVYLLQIDKEFSAALYLSNCDESYRGMHGHDFKVVITLANSELLESGMVFDYNKITLYLNETVTNLDKMLLNDKPEFSRINPTVENIAKYIYETLTEMDITLPLVEVKVQQSRGLTAIYRPN
ncbi:MAG: 6-carboxytetrahydropterin synthase [Spirochaetales bacterium]|nr:6-carboxytetrahydropterin synthase [Spirochaetales bacterium]